MKELLIKIKINCDCGKCKNEYLEHLENHWSIDGGVVELEIIEPKEKKNNIKYNGFFWDDFKNGLLAVNCKTEEIANDFLKEAQKRGYVWNSGNCLIHCNYFDMYGKRTTYSNTYNEFGYSCVEYFVSNGLPIVVWGEVL